MVKALAAGATQVTRRYPPMRLARVADLVEGQPLDFRYPLEEHNNFAIKLDRPAWGGVGPDNDIVAFSYLCSHMGCPLNGLYNHDHAMMGPCPCHFSRFDLTKSGILILGQATQSLPQILLEVHHGDLYALGVSGLVYGFADNLRGGTPVAAT